MIKIPLNTTCTETFFILITTNSSLYYNQNPSLLQSLFLFLLLFLKSYITNAFLITISIILLRLKLTTFIILYNVYVIKKN